MSNQYKNREEELRATVSKEEAITRIKELDGEYDPDGGLSGFFDAWDQLMACESVQEASLIKERRENNVSGSVNGGGNDSRRFSVNPETIFGKTEVISKLSACNSGTSPKIVASLLEVLFSSPETKPGYWLYVAQHWPPRAINRSITKMIKQDRLGQTTIRNPAAYFNQIIKFRKKRRCFTAINGSSK